jgi:GntR family transcriptional repressor for pyruvate dehydrogenase complex
MRKHFEADDLWVVALEEHRAVLKALDPVQAHAAMQRHLKQSFARLMTRLKR